MRRLLLLAFCAAASCGPKGTTDGKPSPSPTPSSGATSAWSAEARSLLERAFGAGRLAWEDPPFKPGERVVWRVRATGTPDVVIDVGRGQPTPDAPGGTWLYEARGAQITLGVDTNGVATRLSWRKASKVATLDDPKEIAKVVPPRPVSDEASFTAAGGTFVGNEVVRVPYGEFRARHGLLTRDGSTFHVYIARSVPGGLIKLEEFRQGAIDPTLVLELEDFEKPKKQ